jgi:PTS system mannitol-specific IIA component
MSDAGPTAAPGAAARPDAGDGGAAGDPGAGLLEERAVRLGERAGGRDEAVRRCGRLLVEIGAVEEPYVAAMLEREHDISTYVGEGVAIPHATNAGRQAVLRDALAVVGFAEPVDWGGEPVSVCVAIAARGDGHLAVLAQLAEILLDPPSARALREAAGPGAVLRLLAPAAHALS